MRVPMRGPAVRPRPVSLLICWAAVLAPRLARAELSTDEQNFSAAIDYVAPSSCPDAAAFEAVVIRRLGFDPFRPDAPDHVLVLILARGRTLEGRLEWRDAAGQWAGDQAFPTHDDDCGSLARTIGLALAVQIHLLGTARSSRPPSQPSSSEPTGPVPPSSTSDSSRQPGSGAPRDRSAVERREAERREAERRASADGEAPLGEPGQGASAAFMLGIGTSVGFGLASAPLPLGRLFAGVTWPSVSLELGGEASSRVIAVRQDGAGLAESIVLASAAACGIHEPLHLCVVTKGGVVHVEGRNTDVRASANGAAVELGLRLGGRERLGHGIFIAERAEGLLNLTRWSGTLDHIPVWTAPGVAWTLGIDAGMLLQ